MKRLTTMAQRRSRRMKVASVMGTRASWSTEAMMSMSVASFARSMRRGGLAMTALSPSWRLSRHPPDVGAAGSELILDPLVATIQVINAVQHRLAVRRQAGQHQRHRRAQVRRHDRGAGQPLDPAHQGRGSVYR